MDDGYYGVIWMFAGNFAPRNWAICDGTLLNISQNQALYSILGTYYGGDGRTTFALPDLRGRAAMGSGSGQGLTPRQIGQKLGVETVTLQTNEIPSHTHITTIGVDPTPGQEASPTNHGIAAHAGGFSESIEADNFLGGVTTANTGGNGAHNNIQPSSVVNYIICIYGNYPSRN